MGVAKYRGYRFQEGVLKNLDGEVIAVDNEREVFELLGLVYVPPCDRTGAHAVVRKRGGGQQMAQGWQKSIGGQGQ